MGRHKITCRSRDVQALNARAMVLVGVGTRGSCRGVDVLAKRFCFFFWGGIDSIKCCLKGVSNWEFSKGIEKKIQLFIHKYHRKHLYNTYIYIYKFNKYNILV